MNIVVNTEALLHNATLLKERVQPAQLCAVVKNNAYGHGIDRVCSALKDIADYFAVGNVEEGLIARRYSDNVLVLLPILSVTDTINAIINDICLTVDSQDTLVRVVNASKLCGKRAKVHVKLDSGMARLGYDCRKVVRWLPQLKYALDANTIDIQGVYSHFACADSDREYSSHQYKEFVDTCNTIKRVLKVDFIRHIANSSATLIDKATHCDMVRCGLSLYGYGDSELLPAKCVTAKVLAIKQLFKGDRVGYDSAYVCSCDCKVAVLDIGYANGLDRVLSGRVYFEYNGKQLKQIGNICMAMCMADCSTVDIQVGDSLTVLSSTHYPIIDKNYSTYQLLCDLR